MNDMKIDYAQKNTRIYLSNVANEWRLLNCNSFKISTYQTYDCIIRKYILESNLNDIPVNQIKTQDIISFSNRLLEQGLSAKTVNDILIVLNSLLKYANKNYLIAKPEIKYIKENKKEMRVLSIDEQRIFENYLKQDMDIFKFGALVSLYTGLRIGELCALQWGDINNQTLKVYKTLHRLYDENGKSKIIIDTPKTNKSNRTIPLPLFLNELIEQRRKEPEMYVLSTSNIEIIEPRLMQIHFKKMVQDCNLENVTFHTLRHTFATRCVECGFDVKTLSEILGHSDVKTTLNKYVHSSMKLKQENMNKLNRIAI